MGQARWSKVASLYNGPRAVGGEIKVSGGRLQFEPHAFDRALKGRELDIAISQVCLLMLTKRSIIPPRRHAFVETMDGVRARFLVNGARDVLRRLHDEARAAGATPSVVGFEASEGPSLN